MKISLIKLEQFSGRSTNFYTVAVDDDDKSLFQHFIESNMEQHGTEIRNLLMRIKAMGGCHRSTGAFLQTQGRQSG